MKKKGTVGVMLVAVILLAGALGAVGCGGKTTTRAVQSTPQAQKVLVASISSDPQAYDGKTVTTEGNYAVGYCSACFLLKDGVSALRVEVGETVPLPPESKLNSRMKVTGRIYVVKGSPNLIASKLEYE